MTTTTTPYSASTGELTVLQVEGEACAVCGRPFRIGDKPRRVGMGVGYQLFAHVLCPKKVTIR